MRPHSVQEVAEFICRHGRQGDLEITYDDNTPFLTTCGIYIDKIADMDYRESLLEVLIPMQIELDGTAQINEFSADQDMDMKL